MGGLWWNIRAFFLVLFSLWLLHFFVNDVWQGRFSFSGFDEVYVFPYQCWVSLVVVTQEYFNDCNIWKTSSCSLTLLFMELCNSSGWMGSLESVWPKPCSLAAHVYEGMLGLWMMLSGWCGTPCLLIFCHFRLRFVLPSLIFWFSIIFDLLESYLRNTPKNKTFQTHGILLLQTLKITYVCIWDLFRKCLVCLKSSFALCQVIYSHKILLFQMLFLHRPEGNFGWSELTKLPSWAGASETTISTASKSETQLSPYWNGIRIWNQ